jgi:hypothetical protein
MEGVLVKELKGNFGGGKLGDEFVPDEGKRCMGNY